MILELSAGASGAGAGAGGSDDDDNDDDDEVAGSALSGGDGADEGAGGWVTDPAELARMRRAVAQALAGGAS